MISNNDCCCESHVVLPWLVRGNFVKRLRCFLQMIIVLYFMDWCGVTTLTMPLVPGTVNTFRDAVKESHKSVRGEIAATAFTVHSVHRQDILAGSSIVTDYGETPALALKVAVPDIPFLMYFVKMILPSFRCNSSSPPCRTNTYLMRTYKKNLSSGRDPRTSSCGRN